MEFKFVCTLLFLLSFFLALQGVKTFGENPNNQDLVRPARSHYYYYYYNYYYYSYSYGNYSYYLPSWAYVISIVICCIICALPCAIFGIGACIAVWISSKNSNQPTHHIATMQTPLYPHSGYSQYCYPQPVQTQGYFPQPTYDIQKTPIGNYTMPVDTLPPAYVTVQEHSQPCTGFQT